MKRIFPMIGLCAIGGAAFGQLPVNQTAENKNVVLEEFTGIHCTFCPDGHKRANDLAAANPGDIVLINIHAGGYATPNAGELDFRTTYGTAIDGISDLLGYPAGQINRRNFSGYEQTDNSGTPVAGILAQGRSTWATTAPIVLAEASYINLALESTIETATRELTVNVEMFETGTAPATYNLNVALLQSGIEEDQTGSSANPAQETASGSYIHNHAFRDLLTGQWGDVITSATGVITRSYTITLPNDINGIPVVLGDMEVVAFIAEGQENIITGEASPMAYILPVGSVEVDASSSTNMTAPAGMCDGTVIPEITVVNEGTNAMTSYDVEYSLNGGAAVVQSISVPLAAGANATHAFPSIVMPAGTNSLAYTVTPSAANEVELSTGNNASGSDSYVVIPATAFDTQHNEGFESNSLGDANPGNSVADNPNDISAFVVDNGISTSVSQNLGGFGTSDNSFRWDFFTIANGDESAIIFEKLDLSGSTGHTIKFSHAYAQYTSESDKLEINVSTDCGATWTNVHSKAGAALMTSAATTTRFYPAVNQWATNSVDISSFDGQSEVMIEFRGVSAYGNDLYIDDIQVLNVTTVSVEEVAELASVNVYPNPSNGIANVAVNLNNDANVAITVYNSLGKVVLTELPTNQSAGDANYVLNMSSLSNGVYFVNVNVNGKSEIRKVSILK